METKELKKEIGRMSSREKIELVEYIIKSIKEQQNRERLEAAAEELQEEYEKNEELTAFTSIDTDDFYEPR